MVEVMVVNIMVMIEMMMAMLTILMEMMMMMMVVMIMVVVTTVVMMNQLERHSKLVSSVCFPCLSLPACLPPSFFESWKTDHQRFD